MLLAVSLDEFLQILTRFGNVFPQRGRGNLRIFGFAGGKKFAVRLTGAVLVAGHDQVQSRVPIAVDVKVLDDRKHLGAASGLVQSGVETPVQTPPRSHLGILL